MALKLTDILKPRKKFTGRIKSHTCNKAGLHKPIFVFTLQIDPAFDH